MTYVIYNVVCIKDAINRQACYWSHETSYKGNNYCKVESSNTSCLEAHADFFRLLVKGISDAYVLRPFGKTNVSELVTRVSTSQFPSAIGWRKKKFQL